ncbi:MAG: response regulator, partial [Opitutaceae bacterium]|nr:response regulator [Opitutaceae bacterium]
LARAGYAATEAAAWSEIVAWLRREAAASRPVLLMMDESVPALVGAEIGRELQAISKTRPLPVVLLTTRPAQPPPDFGHPLAAVLRKPLLRPAAVAEVLQGALRAGTVPATAPVTPAVAPAVRFDVPVLLADDEAVNRLVVRKLLESLGCRVDIAVNGAEAVALARLKDYAVIFMDCRMPELDGFAATLEIRRQLPKPPPIVAITANNTVEDRDHCLQVGMCDFISKPVRRSDMQAALEKWAVRQG